MGTISATTFKRLLALNLVARYQKGIYGGLRFQKVMYLAERQTESGNHAFTYARHHYGQFSHELECIKEQLISMDYIKVSSLNTSRMVTLTLPDGAEVPLQTGGNRYSIPGQLDLLHYVVMLDKVDHFRANAMTDAVESYGYYTEKKLIDLCYDLPEFHEVEPDQIFFESNLPDRIEVPIDDEDCDDLELALNHEFVSSLAKISEGLEQTTIDWETLQNLELSV